MLPARKIFSSDGADPITGTLEKSRLRRFFQTAASLPPAKGCSCASCARSIRTSLCSSVTFAGCLVALHVW
jgi:hypothetical protein